MFGDLSTRLAARPVASRTGERMRYLLVFLGLLTVPLTAGCQGESAESPPTTAYAGRLLAAGNHNNLYVLVTGAVGGIDGFRFWQRDATGLWHACDPGRGRPAALAAWREQLFVFFPSGRWGRFGMGRPVIEPAPVAAWTPAAACEDGLAADAFGYTGAGDPVLLRFADGRWSDRPEMVAGIERDQVVDPQLVRFRDRLLLVWREEVQDFPGSGAPFRIRFLIRSRDGQWAGPLASRLRVASAAHVAAAGETLICLYGKPADPEQADPWFLATYATADEDWHESGPVEGLPSGGPVALARCGDTFLVVTLEDDGPAVARLDVAARRLEPFTPVTAGSAPAASQPWTFLAMMGGMALVILWLAARRARFQAAMAQQAPARTGPPPAPLLRRGAAVAVDYLIVLGSTAVVVSFVAPTLTGAVEQMMAGSTVEMRPILILEGVRLGVMIIYFTLAEGLVGRTLGKAMLGLDVRTDRGTRPAFWQAAVRNLLRPIDELPTLYLLGLALIVSDARGQRLGDRVARTRVVRALATPPERAD